MSNHVELYKELEKYKYQAESLTNEKNYNLKVHTSKYEKLEYD